MISLDSTFSNLTLKAARARNTTRKKVIQRKFSSNTVTSPCPKTLPTVYDRDAPDVAPKPDQKSPSHTNNIHEISSVWEIGRRKYPPATRSYKLSAVRDTEFECYNGMRYILLKHTSDENSTPESDSTENSSTGTENGECLIEPGITNLTTTFLSYRKRKGGKS